MKFETINKLVLVAPATGLALLLAGVGVSLADVPPKETARLIESGDVMSMEAVDKKVQELYPDARVTETELDKEREGYVYELELVDRDSVEWDVDLDAKTGEVLEQERED